ncbi:helix-turn-helix domain-containing protein [Micromonospora sp. RTP1Z1]|uniref:ArsR/SmtB family transcription factor n=1 Tax=Micromonospora sp. RTP1Z1 TaxID=2994043 RepID=UPI0029C6A773|nr:helix-turn-helix domain-containing protein [Micromonospora sp. RTP1Z1]
MSQLRFGASDVAGVRFAVSPVWETVSSMWALDDPVRHAVHLPWIDQARVTLRRPDVAVRVRPLVELLGQIAATPPDVVVRDLLATTPNRPLSPFGRALCDDPGGRLPELVTALRVWYDEAIAPAWPRIRALLEADIAHRAALLAEGGAGQLFGQLHASLRWTGDRVVSDDPWQLDFDLGGRGLALNPGIFTDRRVLWNLLEDSLPGGTYPVRAVATLWETPPVAAGDPLARVIGSARAALLNLLDPAATTTDLARRTGMSGGNVSQHLSALHAAGLVSRSRQGRHVLYRGTEAAAVLLRASRGE